MAQTKATIITIGDELLIGQTIDTNSAWIAQALNNIGIEVYRRVAIADNEEEMQDALDTALQTSDIVLITGGLGPTSDDLTKPFLCKYFNAQLIVDEKVLAHVKQLFAIRNRPFLEINAKQAEVPDAATVLYNEVGTAPGMLFEKDKKWIISMPGVPFEMKGIMSNEVIPRLQKSFTNNTVVHKHLITSGEGESFIAETLKEFETQLPSYIKLSYLPTPGMVKLRLTGTGDNHADIADKLTSLQKQIADILGDIVIAWSDIPMEQILSTALLANNATISLAESCTGGYIAHLLTQIQGSSNYFDGAVVPYHSEHKNSVVGVAKDTLDKYSAISEEVAIELADKTREIFNTDYCLSVTGQLSFGGEDEHIPKGVVWMAVAGAKGIKTKKFQFHYGRMLNKELSAQMGMLMVWKYINDKL